MRLRRVWTAALAGALALAACGGEEGAEIDGQEIGDEIADPADTIAPAPHDPPVPGMDDPEH